jgi:hypothetical protein
MMAACNLKPKPYDLHTFGQLNNVMTSYDCVYSFYIDSQEYQLPMTKKQFSDLSLLVGSKVIIHYYNPGASFDPCDTDGIKLSAKSSND